MNPPVFTDPASELPTLFILGDSISIQYGPFLEHMLAGRYACDRKGSELLANEPSGQPRRAILQRLAEKDIGAEAINGGDSACVLAYLKARDSSKTPPWTILLLNCGLHDLRTDPNSRARQVAPVTYAQNLDEIVRLAARTSIQAVWLRTTPVADDRHQRLNPEFHRFNADVEDYNRIADAIMDQAGIPRIDLYRYTLGLSAVFGSLDALFADHVHFIEPVQQLQAAYIAGWLDASPFA